MIAETDKMHEECAVVGVVGCEEAAKYCYLGLYAMQHRGQEGAGIVSCNNAEMFPHRDMGLVADVFSGDRLSQLQGDLAVGHARYATFGTKDRINLQPLVANFSDNSFAIAHNGNLVNANELRSELEASGAIFSTTSDTEVIFHLIARVSSEKSVVEKLQEALSKVRGAYSLVVMTQKRIIGARDPAGVRPLSLGKIGEGYVLASETCAFDLIGAEFIRDIEPGEIVNIPRGAEPEGGIQIAKKDPALCVFEYIYFSRPDSIIEGRSVYAVRKRLGAELAKEHPAQADLVIPVPDSGVPASIGFAQEIGLPLELGLIRNHYVGRTFIEPSQEIRDFGVKIKLNPDKELLKGKRVIVVDDSIVRGTTSKKIVKMLRNAGAKEVHLRVSSPPTTGPCYYGIDTPSKKELIAAKHSVPEIKNYLDVDSLGYLSIEAMYRAVGAPRKGFCDACFSDKYRLGTP